MRVWLLLSKLILSSERAIYHPAIPQISAVLPLRARLHCMSIDRANLGGNIGNFLVVIYLPTHPHIYVQGNRVFLRTRYTTEG